MVLMKMLMNIGLPKMRGLMVITMAMISPFGREVPSTESLRRKAKVLLPRFRLETAALRPESTILNFFRVKENLYEKMSAIGRLGGPLDIRSRQGCVARPGV